MRLRNAALIATTAGAVAGLVWWRRRGRATSPPPVQLGLADGGVHVPDAEEPAAVVLQALAADVWRSLPETS